jgi:hypothetical protein
MVTTEVGVDDQVLHAYRQQLLNHALVDKPFVQFKMKCAVF